ncbi:MAG: glycosyltransferase [Faecalibacterium prausnitzii]
MNVRLKRAKELMGYAVQLTKDEGLPTMVKRGAGFVRRRFFGKRARYLPGKKVLEAQAAEMVGKTAENCGLPTISILTPLYNTPENYLREFLGSFVNQTAPNGQLCLADASDDAHPEVERVVREYQQKNQRIVYKKVENKGIAANTNAAETLATGEYLALADHDDVLAPTPCTRWVRLSCSSAKRGSRMVSSTVTRRSSPRTSKSRWWDTSSPIMPRIICFAATTSVIWRSSSGRCMSSWAANAPSATAVRTTTSSSGSSNRPAVRLICRRCSTTGGSMPVPLPAAPMPSPMWRRRPKRHWPTI